MQKNALLELRIERYAPKNPEADISAADSMASIEDKGDTSLRVEPSDNDIK